MTTGEIIKSLRIKMGMSQQELAEKVGYISRSSINKIENNLNGIKQSKILEFAKALNVSPDTLFDVGKLNNESLKVITDNIYNIPIFESVSAGFGTYACSDVIGYMPLYIKNSADASDTLCIKVTGDSMYPKIEDGDTIVVRKQSSVDSGSIAVVLIDGDDGLVKKIVYGDDWIELISINPEYQPKRFEGAEVQRIRVVGVVKQIIKEV